MTNNTVEWWLSCSRFTVCVTAEASGEGKGEETIVKAALIVRKFVGQPLKNLVRWMGEISRYSGGVKVVRL
jgi:hypothetical protein